MNMSGNRFANPEGLYDPSSNGYSHVAVVPGGSRLVFVAGQGGENAEGALPKGFAAQLDQAFANVAAALRCESASLCDVVKFTILVVDHDERRLAAISDAVAARFDTRLPPACTLIPVPRLALDGMLVEIEAVAALAAAD